MGSKGVQGELMLSISNAMKGAGCGDYYLRISSEEYYARSGAERGRWFGGAVGDLVQSPDFDHATFTRLLDGFDARHNALVQNAGDKDRWRGWDLTLSAPKSVSVLWAIAPKRARRLIRKAHDAAVREALGWVEQHHCIARRGKGGKMREHARVLFASFFHSESRSLDPQLHTHSVLLNLAIRADRTTGALHSIDFFRTKKEAGEVYQTALKRQLFERLRLSCVEEKVGFRIVGVPERLCEHFSKRRAEIKSKMEELGLHGPIALKEITLKTRRGKVDVRKSALFHLWRGEAEKLGWGARCASDLIAAGEVERRWEKAEKKAPEQNRYRSETPLAKAKKRAAEILAKTSNHVESEETVNRPRAESNQNASWRNFPLASQNSAEDHTERHTNGGTSESALKRKKKDSEKEVQEKPKKWGKVIWRNDWFVNELRIQERYLFPGLPAWCPLSKLTEARLRVVTGPPVKNQAVAWEGNFGPVKAKVTTTQAFKRAPAWSPAKHIRIPRVSVAITPNTSQQQQSETKGHGHHSH
jgi:conjugative relaxase-like TrwC/TraI family protein